MQDSETSEDAPPPRELADVSVSLWDIHRKLQPIPDEKLGKRSRLMLRRAEKALDALKSMGLTIDDPIGRRYGEGGEGTMLPHFQPQSGVTVETVVETVSPVIYWNDQLIQRGEVFVAVPEATTGTTAVDMGAAAGAPAEPPDQRAISDSGTEGLELAPQEPNNTNLNRVAPADNGQPK